MTLIFGLLWGDTGLVAGDTRGWHYDESGAMTDVRDDVQKVVFDQNAWWAFSTVVEFQPVMLARFDGTAQTVRTAFEELMARGDVNEYTRLVAEAGRVLRLSHDAGGLCLERFHPSRGTSEMFTHHGGTFLSPPADATSDDVEAWLTGLRKQIRRGPVAAVTWLFSQAAVRCDTVSDQVDIGLMHSDGSTHFMTKNLVGNVVITGGDGR
jgi:hypothetical protein